MQILDKHNHLFGKIHVLVIGVPLLAIMVILAALSLFGRPGDFVTVRIKGGPGNWWWVTPRPPEWYVSSVEVGDTEIDSLGRMIASVEDIRIYESGGPNKDIYLRARLRVSYNPLSKKYKYKGQPVQIGAPISLELKDTLFSGNVVDVFVLEDGVVDQRYEMGEKIVTLRLYNAYAWEYDAIKIGEQMQDGAGNTIAEILNKFETPPQLSAATFKEGKLIFGSDPILRDITVSLKVSARKEGQSFVFREEQYLKVGKELWAFFPSYDIAGAKIIAVQDSR